MLVKTHCRSEEYLTHSSSRIFRNNLEQSENAFAKCKKSRSGHGSSNRQTISQANVCGNGNGALDINCQNLASQVQGDGNAVNIIGVQN